MNPLQQLQDVRLKFHIQIRSAKIQKQKIISRNHIIHRIHNQINQNTLINFKTALENILKLTHLQPSFDSLIHKIHQTKHQKQESNLAIFLIEKGLLKTMAKLISQKKHIDEIMIILVFLSTIEYKVGNFIIRSGIIPHILEIAESNPTISFEQNLLCIFGSICAEDAQNRNIIGDAELHLQITKQIQERVLTVPTIYTKQTNQELKNLWDYRFWFLQKFYAYNVLGEVVPQNLTDVLISLMNSQTPFTILNKVMYLLSNIKIFGESLCVFQQSVRKMIDKLSLQFKCLMEFTYMLSQFPSVQITNFSPFLMLLNPKYFGLQFDNKLCESSIIRILFARKNHLVGVVELYEAVFWEYLLLRPFSSLQRYMILSILNQIDLQNIDWILKYFSEILQFNGDVLAINCVLEFILKQIDRKGKKTIEILLCRNEFDKVLTKLEQVKDEEVSAKLKMVCDLFS